MKSGTQVTHGLVSILLTVTNLKIRFPPKVFIIKRVVHVKENHMVGQGFHVFEIGGIDERMWRCQLFVIAVKTENDRQNWSSYVFKKPRI